jgi:type VI protein secretion system component Hcp
MKASMSRSPAAGVTITGHNDSVTETDVSDTTVIIAGNNDRVSLAHVSDIAVDIRGDGDTITANGGDAGRVKLNFPFLFDGNRDHIRLLVAVPPGTPVVPNLNLSGNISVGGNNDSVLVSFEAGSVSAPILIGSLNDNVSVSGNNDSVTGNMKLLADSTAGTSATASLNRDSVVTGNGDQLNLYLLFRFSVPYTSHFNVTGNNDSPTENITLNFGEVAITYTDQTVIAGDHNGVFNSVSLLAGNGMMTSSNPFAICTRHEHFGRPQQPDQQPERGGRERCDGVRCKSARRSHWHRGEP